VVELAIWVLDSADLDSAKQNSRCSHLMKKNSGTCFGQVTERMMCLVFQPTLVMSLVKTRFNEIALEEGKSVN
jgi:hypothetical protein